MLSASEDGWAERGARLLKTHGAFAVTDGAFDVGALAAETREALALVRRQGCARDAARCGPEPQRFENPSGDLLILGRRDEITAAWPQIAAFYGEPAMGAIAAAYFGEDVVHIGQVIVTHDFRPVDSILPFHFDDVRSLKFMIYLDDTRDGGGAFEFIPATTALATRLRRQEWRLGSAKAGVRSHVFEEYADGEFEAAFGESPEAAFDRRVRLDLPAGTLIVFDTDVLHRAGPLSAGRERTCIRASSYGGFHPAMLRAIAAPARFTILSTLVLGGRLTAQALGEMTGRSPAELRDDLVAMTAEGLLRRGHEDRAETYAVPPHVAKVFGQTVRDIGGAA